MRETEGFTAVVSRSHILGAAIAVMLFCCLQSCSTPDAVSKFCGSAVATLTSAKPIFEDMKQSCLREVNSREDFGAFRPQLKEDPYCTAIGDQAEGAEAAAKLLADYFNAINAIASFGAAKTSTSEAAKTSTTPAATDTQSLAKKAGAAVSTSSPAQQAVVSIAQFLSSAVTAGYRGKSLDRDLAEVNANISAVVAALTDIVQEDYLDRQLKNEEDKLSIRYRDYAKGKSPEVQVMLDARWQADEQALEAKRASAQSLITALQAISKGMANLAANTHKLNTKDVSDLLAPYATQIESLLPQIQKAF